MDQLQAMTAHNVIHALQAIAAGMSLQHPHHVRLGSIAWKDLHLA